MERLLSEDADRDSLDDVEVVRWWAFFVDSGTSGSVEVSCLDRLLTGAREANHSESDIGRSELSNMG